jgi:glycine/D-amino acid oxidase-like deaminating enzyme
MSRNATFDVLILGQGLAGSTLAWRLAERGVSIVLIDRGGVDEIGYPSASRVAAGLITPVTGKRLTVADDYEALWASAEAFYRRVEQQCGESLLKAAPAVRVFADTGERRTFLDRLDQGKLRDQARLANKSELPRGISAPHGAFVMGGAARLRVAAYLEATRRWLESAGRYVLASLDPEHDIEVTPHGLSVPSLNVSARRLVLCQGFTPESPRWLADVEFRPAKGEVLTIEPPGYSDSRVIHHGVWIAPEDSAARRYRVGSTTEWRQLDSTPTEAAHTELLSRLSAAGVNDSQVIEHLAAVRPATYDRKPTFGFGPEAPSVGWLNGLGAKGSLWAPFYADRMAGLVVASLR